MANFESGFKTTLAVALTPAASSMSVATAPTVTAGRLFLDNGAQQEWIKFTGVTPGTPAVLTGLTRSLSKTADPSTGSTGLSWIAGTVVKLVQMHDQIVDKSDYLSTAHTWGAKQTFGDVDITGTVNLSSVGDLNVNGTSNPYPVVADTTARDALYPSPVTGDTVYVEALNAVQVYNTGTVSWETQGAGTTVNNATNTVTGIVKIANGTQIAGGSSTTPEYVLGVKDIVKTAATAAENKIPALNSALMIERRYTSFFGGDGSDGVQGDANLTIAGSNNTTIIKNFTSWTAGSVSRTCTITPTNCVTIIRISGNADFTNWTFNFSGKGGQANAGDGSAGSAGICTFYNSTCGGGLGLSGGGTAGGGGGLNAAGANGTVNGGAAFPIKIAGIQSAKTLFIACGGGGGNQSTNLGGHGGGAVIFEIAGNITLAASTTLNFSGTNGVSNSAGGGGGGFILLYNGTLTNNSPTINVAGGTGGQAGGAGDYLIAKNITR